MKINAHRIALLAAALLPAACSHPAASVTHAQVACKERAARAMAANASVIRAHQYSAASHNAERAARISLACGDRWRASNAFVVAAELAHQAKQQRRAHDLLARGYALMHSVHLRNATALTSTLMAERLDTARRDMRGQWAYW